MVVAELSMNGQKSVRFHLKDLHLCSEDEHELIWVTFKNEWSEWWESESTGEKNKKKNIMNRNDVVGFLIFYLLSQHRKRHLVHVSTKKKKYALCKCITNLHGSVQEIKLPSRFRQFRIGSLGRRQLHLSALWSYKLERAHLLLSQQVSEKAW